MGAHLLHPPNRYCRILTQPFRTSCRQRLGVPAGHAPPSGTPRCTVPRLRGCWDERGDVARALRAREAETFERAAAAVGLVAAMLRRFAEWDAHPQGRAVAALPLLMLSRIGDAPPQPLSPGPDRPLSGVRVLDLTRII